MMTLWTDDDTRFLISLLETNTVTPMETGRVGEALRAQRMFCDYAEGCGAALVHLESPTPADASAQGSPASIASCARAMGDEFWSAQPNGVLAFGDNPSRCVMFNFHMDTVSPHLPVRVQGGTVYGRGVIDAKGLGVAVLVGLRAAFAKHPEMARDIRVLVQSVCGEEGGAMGFYGTRKLADLGFTGRLNIVCEPTSGAFIDRTTASMTCRVDVDGPGSTDDHPEVGVNATILLGFIATRFTDLAQTVKGLDAKICVAGIETGHLHNRVYGSGHLWVNLAYGTTAVGRRLQELIQEAFAAALADFKKTYGTNPIALVAAEKVFEVCRLVWVKRDLPVLCNRDHAMEFVLLKAGLRRHAEDTGIQPFTCDAMWLAREGAYTVVLGPGDLGAHGAHTEHEHLPLEAMTNFSRQVADITIAYWKHGERRDTAY